VLPFSIVIRSGRSLHDQVVFAVTKAVITGQLQPGDRFPPVRVLSQELRINPNTAQKTVATLVERGLLETRPGIGTTVAAWKPNRRTGRRGVPVDPVERLVVEAKSLGLSLAEVLDAIRREWKQEEGE
jgi:GntR family transcriptional regulator